MKIKTKLIKSLTEFFNTKMEEYGNKDFSIDNIRLSVDLEGDTEKSVLLLILNINGICTDTKRM